MRPTLDADGSAAEQSAPQRERASKMLAWALLTITSLCWAANTIFARLAVGEVSPMALVTLRWLFVLGVLVVIARKPLREDWPLLRPHLGRISAMGALGFTVFNVMFYAAAHHTTAINLGIIQAVMPIFIFVIAFVRFRIRMTMLQGVGVLAAVLGVLLVAAHGDWRHLLTTRFNGGDLTMIAASLLYAGYTVALRARPASSALAFFAVMAGAAFVTSIPFALYEWMAGELVWPTPTGWALVAGIALLPSLLSQLLFMRGVELIGPGRAGLFVNLVPVLASAMAVVLLGEAFHWYHGAALALVFAGIGLSEREGRA